MNLLKFLLTVFCCKDYFFPQSVSKVVNQTAKKSFIDPHFVKGHGGIVQLFEWKWNDIALECESFLAPSGYGGVQVSPPNENVIVAGRPWYERYQPISYMIKTRSGGEEEFLDMTKRCNKVGVRIYVDVVFNHMAANQPSYIANGTAGSSAIPEKRFYPVPYTVQNFHPQCSIEDYQDPYQVRNCELVGLHDLNQTLEDTRDKIILFLNHLLELGVAGFRVDAAKHQWPNDLEIIYNRLNFLNTSFGFSPELSPFIYQEVIDNGNEAVSKYEYIFAVVAEFRYLSEIGRSFTGNDDLKWLSGFGEKWDLLPSELAVVFVGNHDSQRNDGTLTYKMRRNYIMAQAFSLAHPYGQKRIMSSYDFDTTAQGPPCDKNENILSPVVDSTGNCTNGWICEHRWKEISAMVEFMNVVNGENVTSWWDNGKNQIAFSRGSKGFVAFNLDYEDMTGVLITTEMDAGLYCDVIDGTKNSESTCSGRTIEVSKEGTVAMNLVQQSVAAIHKSQKLL